MDDVTLTRRIFARSRIENMTQKSRLNAVPDTSMLSLFKALVNFLAEEAKLRNWEDVSERLKAVEQAIAQRDDRG